VRDPTAQGLLWRYAQRRRLVDAEFSEDLEHALREAGYVPLEPDADDGEEEVTGQCERFLVDPAPASGRILVAILLVAAGELTTRCFVSLPNDSLLAHAFLCLVLFALGCLIGRPLDRAPGRPPDRSPDRRSDS
jgi:hypothetical protein